MILGIGNDLVEIARMNALVTRWGEKAGRRLLAPVEEADFRAAADPARFLAKRFAVKEAFAKAMGTGLRDPVLCTRIGVVHDTMGKPQLWLSAEVARFAAERGVLRHHVSISDERLYALAFVVLEGSPS
ncbi:holo-ACP synthase [Paludibacterium paludis]|uniref:Holo-[acyl-carrier-protein] synthase n=1 Tax=Paludibacterium paludis TaxID=1225769 RepID=A0A918U891_9NEIS|nr:holo-ACP synthase [Paludibacterium paludis]GGY06330.1 holo-[acyl-carrier-protein] synthase [Paludibacterium paludis]